MLDREFNPAIDDPVNLSSSSELSTTQKKKFSKHIPPPILIKLAQGKKKPSIVLDNESINFSTPLPDLTLQAPMTPGPQLSIDLLSPLSSICLDAPARSKPQPQVQQSINSTMTSNLIPHHSKNNRLSLQSIKMGGNSPSGVNLRKTHSVKSSQLLTSCEAEGVIEPKKKRKLWNLALFKFKIFRSKSTPTIITTTTTTKVKATPPTPLTPTSENSNLLEQPISSPDSLSSDHHLPASTSESTKNATYKSLPPQNWIHRLSSYTS